MTLFFRIAAKRSGIPDQVRDDGNVVGSDRQVRDKNCEKRPLIRFTLNKPVTCSSCGMRTILIITMALVLSSCGSESSTFDKFADARWAKSPENCKTEFTTFDERSIRFHSPGGVIEFGKIVKIGDASPTIAALTVEPSPIIKEAARKSQNPLLSEAVTMGFELNGERLRLRGLVGGPRSQLGAELRSDAAEYQLFDLTRC